DYAPSCSICSRQRRISEARKRRWPPRVRIAVILPARAQRVTVFGFTRNSAATSAGVSSASGVISSAIGPPGHLSDSSRKVRHGQFDGYSPSVSFFVDKVSSYALSRAIGRHRTLARSDRLYARIEVQIFDRIGGDDYEQVVFCHDRPTGHRAIGA